MRRWPAAVGVSSAVLALACPPAGAGGGSFVTFGPGHVLAVHLVHVRVSGQVDVDFHGDRAAGCAPRGLCDVEGSVSWQPAGTGELTMFDTVLRGRRETSALLDLSDQNGEESVKTFARVRRTALDGTVSTCSDAVTSESVSGLAEVRGGTLRLGLAGPASEGPAFVTRCGGPLSAEVARALTSRPLSLAAARRGRRTVDLRAEHTFSAGGLAGTVRSSVLLRLGAGTSFPGDGTGQDPPSDEFRKQLDRVLTVHYEVERVGGALTTSFEGLPQPGLCGPVGACGSAGSSELTPSGTSGQAFLLVRAPARRGRRLLRAAVGLTPGGRERGISVFGNLEWHSRTGAVSESVHRADGSACADSAPVRAGNVGFSVAGQTARFDYLSDSATDPVRTRCPGPMALDAAPSGSLASGTVPLRALGARRVSIALSRGGGFSADGYRGRRSSTITIVLRRTGVSEQTFSTFVPNATR